MHVLNINQGHNEALMNACQPLREYAAYTAKVRENIKAGYPVREAVTGCIREGILEEFLRRNRSEAMKVSIYEYDAERHLRMEREEARADGYRDGQADGYQEGHRKGYRQGQNDLQKKFVSVMLKNGKTIAQIAADLDEDEQVIQELIKHLPK